MSQEKNIVFLDHDNNLRLMGNEWVSNLIDSVLIDTVPAENVCSFLGIPTTINKTIFGERYNYIKMLAQIQGFEESLTTCNGDYHPIVSFIKQKNVEKHVNENYIKLLTLTPFFYVNESFENAENVLHSGGYHDKMREKINLQ